MSEGRWIYLACVADRHADPTFRLFTEPEPAKDWVRRAFRATVAHPDNVFESGPMPPYLVYWSYGEESDHAWVQAIQEPA